MILRRLVERLLSRIRSLVGAEAGTAKGVGCRSLAEIFQSLEESSEALVKRHQVESSTSRNENA